MINHSQTLGLIQSLDLKWPDYISNLFQVISKLGFISTDILSLDCFMGGIMLNIQGIYIKAISTFSFYLFFIWGTIIFFSIKKFIFKQKRQFDKFIMVFLVFSAMMQPTFIQQNSDIFTCKKVGNSSYLLRQMSIECYTDSHFKWVFIIFIAFLA